MITVDMIKPSMPFSTQQNKIKVKLNSEKYFTYLIFLLIQKLYQFFFTLKIFVHTKSFTVKLN